MCVRRKGKRKDSRLSCGDSFHPVLRIERSISVTFSFQTPDIVISAPEEGLRLYYMAEITATFTNPLDRVLTRAKFMLSGDGHVQDATVDVP